VTSAERCFGSGVSLPVVDLICLKPSEEAEVQQDDQMPAAVRLAQAPRCGSPVAAERGNMFCC